MSGLVEFGLMISFDVSGFDLHKCRCATVRDLLNRASADGRQLLIDERNRITHRDHLALGNGHEDLISFDAGDGLGQAGCGKKENQDKSSQSETSQVIALPAAETRCLETILPGLSVDEQIFEFD